MCSVELNDNHHQQQQQLIKPRKHSAVAIATQYQWTLSSPSSTETTIASCQLHASVVDLICCAVFLVPVLGPGDDCTSPAKTVFCPGGTLCDSGRCRKCSNGEWGFLSKRLASGISNKFLGQGERIFLNKDRSEKYKYLWLHVHVIFPESITGRNSNKQVCFVSIKYQTFLFLFCLPPV